MGPRGSPLSSWGQAHVPRAPPHKLPSRSAWARGHAWDTQVPGGDFHVKVSFQVTKWPEGQGCVAENVRACILEGRQCRPWIPEASRDTLSPRRHTEGRATVRELRQRQTHVTW